MLLAIDVGNTHTVLGVYQGERLGWNWRLESDRRRTVDEFALQIMALFEHEKLEITAIDTVVLSCVVPPLSRVFTKLSQKYFGLDAVVTGHDRICGMKVLVDEPSRVGSDRLVNAFAARELYGAPVIVVDFGTATTFDIVSTSGAYEGGVIAPGLLISAEALFEKAAMLPNIQLLRPGRVLGKNTHDAMRSGIFFGYVALVDGLVERLFDELNMRPRVIATGGFSWAIAEESRYIEEVAPNLTLDGLRIIGEAEKMR